jgi:predicted enzyme related to lactoylglutathione lyase
LIQANWQLRIHIDLRQTQAKVQEFGGSTISGTEDDSNSGLHINFRDPQGNRFGAYMLKPKGT